MRTLLQPCWLCFNLIGFRSSIIENRNMLQRLASDYDLIAVALEAIALSKDMMTLNAIEEPLQEHHLAGQQA